jgi:hypothetical protein
VIVPNNIVCQNRIPLELNRFTGPLGVVFTDETVEVTLCFIIFAR